MHMKITTREQLDGILAEIKVLLDKGGEPAMTRIVELEGVLGENGYETAVARSQAARARAAATKQRVLPFDLPPPSDVKVKPAARLAPPPPAVQGPATLLQVEEGDYRYFTVEDDAGHVTFRVERQAKNAKFAPGEVIISRLVGPNNEADYQGVAFAKPDGRVIVWKKSRGDERLVRALEVLAQDPKAAGKAYAVESGRCWMCNRMLTTPESIEAGIGPICAEKLGV